MLIKHRLRAVFDGLATQQALRSLPVALLGIDDEVPGGVAAAARLRPAALRSLILLDGRPYPAAALLARLSQPTLMVVGASDTRSLNRNRAAMRLMSSPSRFEVLSMATRPLPAPGARQAIAHAAMYRLDKTLWAEDLSKAAGGGVAAARPRAQGAASAAS